MTNNSVDLLHQDDLPWIDSTRRAFIGEREELLAMAELLGIEFEGNPSITTIKKSIKIIIESLLNEESSWNEKLGNIKPIVPGPQNTVNTKQRILAMAHNMWIKTDGVRDHLVITAYRQIQLDIALLQSVEGINIETLHKDMQTKIQQARNNIASLRK